MKIPREDNDDSLRKSYLPSHNNVTHNVAGKTQYIQNKEIFCVFWSCCSY